MGLISPGGKNLLDFLEFRQVLSTYEGDLRDSLWWLQERLGQLSLWFPFEMNKPKSLVVKGLT